jgi:hypothetical protein
MTKYPNKDIHFIFMTDGGASYPQYSVNRMKSIQADYGAKGKKFIYTSVGIGIDPPVL